MGVGFDPGDFRPRASGCYFILGGLNELRASGLQSIGMTSNGISLKPRLAQLQQSGLDRLNISLDTLREEKYSFITRRKGEIISSKRR